MIEKPILIVTTVSALLAVVIAALWFAVLQRLDDRDAPPETHARMVQD